MDPELYLRKVSRPTYYLKGWSIETREPQLAYSYAKGGDGRGVGGNVDDIVMDGLRNLSDHCLGGSAVDCRYPVRGYGNR